MGFPKGRTERNKQAGRELVHIVRTEYEKHGSRLHAGAIATLRARMSFIGNHGTAEAFAIEWSAFRENVPEMGAELRRLIHLAARSIPQPKPSAPTASTNTSTD